MPPLAANIALVNAYGAQVVGIGLNTMGLSLEEARGYQTNLADELNLPVILPLEDGVGELLKAINL